MNNKIKQFIKRNKRRNNHLYKENLIEGYDYVICPISNERLSMIKSNYITKVLGMSVKKYDKLYPNQQKICKQRIKNISNGLNKLDIKTGLTKHQLSVKKSRKTLTKINNGITGDQLRAIKTKNSNLKNIINGKNGYQRTAEKARPKQIKTMMEQGKIANCKYRKE